MFSGWSRNFLVFLTCAALLSRNVVWSAETSHEIEQFSVSLGADTIAGEVHRIKGSEPATALIIAGGSGVCSRSDTSSAVPLFLRGKTAIVLVDRRGCGTSTGTFTRPGTRNSRWLVPRLAMDLEAVADYLRTDGFSRVGVLGSSFGGWLAVSAAGGDRLDFFVTMNGGAQSVAMSDTFDRLTDDGMTIDQAITETRATALIRSYDPTLDLERISVPGVFILATNDASNPMVLDKESIEYWRLRGKPFEAIIVNDADHELVNTTTGEVDLNWVPRVNAFIEGSLDITIN
ncbi:MAG: alpha/beta hydrolase [Gammaproteobacteria bacterium]